jgi:hypothetical protein
MQMDLPMVRSSMSQKTMHLTGQEQPQMGSQLGFIGIVKLTQLI